MGHHGTFFCASRFFNGVFVRFSTRGVQEHHFFLNEESPCQKLQAKKVEGENTFSLPFFPSVFFYRIFGRFRMMSLKTPQKLFLQPGLAFVVHYLLPGFRGWTCTSLHGESASRQRHYCSALLPIKNKKADKPP
jgi:hypothetical protein